MKKLNIFLILLPALVLGALLITAAAPVSIPSIPEVVQDSQYTLLTPGRERCQWVFSLIGQEDEETIGFSPLGAPNGYVPILENPPFTGSHALYGFADFPLTITRAEILLAVIGEVPSRLDFQVIADGSTAGNIDIPASKYLSWEYFGTPLDEDVIFHLQGSRVKMGVYNSGLEVGDWAIKMYGLVCDNPQYASFIPIINFRWFWK